MLASFFIFCICLPFVLPGSKRPIKRATAYFLVYDSQKYAYIVLSEECLNKHAASKGWVTYQRDSIGAMAARIKLCDSDSAYSRREPESTLDPRTFQTETGGLLGEPQAYPDSDVIWAGNPGNPKKYWTQLADQWAHHMST